jgi:pSer/pThr/pTyr-binding forkhead associated (FHA) protein
VVVDAPTVSGRHCRLIETRDGLLLEDLGSTNGTFVHGTRISGRIRIKKGDAVTLGATTPMPWPATTSPFESVLLIGREADNDYVINVPTVSGYHALLVRDAKTGGLWIEDLNSSNGTAVGSADRKVTRSPVRATDILFFGSHSVRIGDVLAGRATQVAEPAAPATGRAEWQTPMRIGILLLQAPVIATAIVALLNQRGAGDGAGASAVGAILGWLSLSAVWFGLSSAVLSTLVDPANLREGLRTGQSLLGRLTAVVGLSMAQCLIAWAIVAVGSGLKGPAFSVLLVLELASCVGAGIGVLLLMLTGRLSGALVALPIILVVLCMFGGGSSALHRVSWSRAFSTLAPSRWAFEGVLLLEAGYDGRTGDAPAAAQVEDIVEEYFPADSDRYGTRAAVLALGLMLVGVVGAGSFISWSWRPEPGSH